MSLNVLLVDDDIIINFMHRKFISSIYDEVNFVVCTNGLEALQFLRNNKNKELLVFLDINMPLMDGWEVLEAISDEFDNKMIKVVVVSSSIDKEDKERAVGYKSVMDFISKPLKSGHIVHLKENLKW